MRPKCCIAMVVALALPGTSYSQGTTKDALPRQTETAAQAAATQAAKDEGAAKKDADAKEEADAKKEADTARATAAPLLYSDLSDTCKNYADAVALLKQLAKPDIGNYLEGKPDAPIVAFCRVVANPKDIKQAWDEGRIPSLEEIRKAKSSSAAFLKNVPNLTAPETVTTTAASEGSLTPPSMDGEAIAPYSAGPPREGAVLWGLTDALVKRASEELNVWFLQRVRDEVCTTPEDDAENAKAFHVSALVVETCKVMTATPLLSEIPGGYSTLRSAAQLDLEALVATGAEEGFRLVHQRANDSDRQQKEDALLVLNYIGRIVKLAKSQQDLLTAIRNAPMKGLPEGLDPSTARIPTMLYQFSFILQSLNYPTLTRLTGTDVYYVFGASLVNAREAHVISKEWIPTGFAKLPPHLMEMIAAAAADWANIETLIKEAAAARKGGEAETAAQKYAEALTKMSGLLQTWVNALCFDDNGGLFPYPCSTIKSSKGWKVLTDSAPMLTSIAKGEYGAALITLTTMLGPKDSTVLSPNGRRVIAFVVGLAQAKTADSASAAIQAFIAPQGSYLIKRNNANFYFNVNAYAGIFPAFEHLGAVDGKDVFTFAPWVPVGIELGFGSRDWSLIFSNLRIGSTSILFQAIDVGALASYRVSTRTVENAPDVGLKQVFSPGAFLMLGVKNAPLSIGVGASYAPELRRITSTGGTTTSASAWRYGVTFALDIPLFP